MTEINNFEEEIEKNYKYNFKYNFMDGTFFWFGSSFIAAQTILPAFVSNITTSPIIIGMISAIWATGWYLPQLFTANWVQSLPIKKFVPVKIGFFSERIPILLLPLAAWLTIKSPIWALVVFFFLYIWHCTGAGFIAVAWQDMIAKIIPTDRRGRFFGITNFAGTFTGLIGAFYSVKIIRDYQYPYNYMICFGIAAFAILLSWVFLSRTKEPAQVNPKPRSSQQDFKKSLRNIFEKDKNFVNFIIYRIVALAGGTGLGFVAIYSKMSLHTTDNMIASFTIAMLSGQAVANLFYGWLADKKGHKASLVLGNIAGILVIIVTIFTKNPQWLYLSFFLMGFYNAGFMLSGIAIVFEFCDPEIRPTYIGIANTSAGIVTGISPILGGWIAQTKGYSSLFVGTIFIWLIGLFLLKFVVKEPRDLKNIVLD